MVSWDELARTTAQGLRRREGLAPLIRPLTDLAGKRRAAASGTEGPGRLPTFLGLGAQRCGTSWWFNLLLQHPDVHGPANGRKELHVFDRIDPAIDLRILRKRYATHFAAQSGACGEWTPRYMIHPNALHLAAATLDEPRLIVLLRDPVARYYSAIEHDKAKGKYRTGESEMEAFARGFYSWQVEVIHALFEPDSLLVLQYEQCVAATEHWLNRSFAHLGVDHNRYEWKSMEPAEQRRPRRIPENGFTEFLRDSYSVDRSRLAERVSEFEAALWQ
jgi:hypothetical protein